MCAAAATNSQCVAHPLQYSWDAQSPRVQATPQPPTDPTIIARILSCSTRGAIAQLLRPCTPAPWPAFATHAAGRQEKPAGRTRVIYMAPAETLAPPCCYWRCHRHHHCRHSRNAASVMTASGAMTSTEAVTAARRATALRQPCSNCDAPSPTFDSQAAPRYKQRRR
jgi:hypothetical protein